MSGQDHPSASFPHQLKKSSDAFMPEDQLIIVVSA